MSGRAFMIADLHLGHKKVTEFRPFSTVEEHDWALVENWNSRVTKRDVVWVLGDVAFTKDGMSKLGLMNGTKKLVLGNHDIRCMREYMQYFTQIYGTIKFDNYVLTHVPIHPSQFYRFAGNIHGHLHSESLMDPRYFCVSAEHTNYTPMLYSEVLERINAQPEKES